MIDNGACSGEVKVAVVGQVHYSGLIGGCAVLNLEGVVVCEGVGDVCRECAGVAFVAIGTGVGEVNTLSSFGSFGVPDHLVEAVQPAVKVVGAVVGGECVGLAVECKLTVSNAVAVSTDNSTEVGRGTFISIERVVAQHNIGHLAVAIGNGD